MGALTLCGESALAADVRAKAVSLLPTWIRNLVAPAVATSADDKATTTTTTTTTVKTTTITTTTTTTSTKSTLAASISNLLPSASTPTMLIMKVLNYVAVPTDSTLLTAFQQLLSAIVIHIRLVMPAANDVVTKSLTYAGEDATAVELQLALTVVKQLATAVSVDVAGPLAVVKEVVPTQVAETVSASTTTTTTSSTTTPSSSTSTTVEVVETLAVDVGTVAAESALTVFAAPELATISAVSSTFISLWTMGEEVFSGANLVAIVEANLINTVLEKAMFAETVVEMAEAVEEMLTLEEEVLTTSQAEALEAWNAHLKVQAALDVEAEKVLSELLDKFGLENIKAEVDTWIESNDVETLLGTKPSII